MTDDVDDCNPSCNPFYGWYWG